MQSFIAAFCDERALKSAVMQSSIPAYFAGMGGKESHFFLARYITGVANIATVKKSRLNWQFERALLEPRRRRKCH
jgi:hypothetical protein